ncbi:MAG: hypothetical protein M1837_000009 [Sclerophora amabilis]|nr:MAG: hypothetical protein M1837_000009 [Sclerophora amabilis]
MNGGFDTAAVECNAVDEARADVNVIPGRPVISPIRRSTAQRSTAEHSRAQQRPARSAQNHTSSFRSSSDVVRRGARPVPTTHAAPGWVDSPRGLAQGDSGRIELGPWFVSQLEAS